MRDLPPAVRAIGHPVVASALTGTLMLGFFACIAAGHEGVWLALTMLLPAAWVARAAEAVKRQRDWQRAWDGMIPSAPAARSNELAKAAAVAVMIAAFWVMTS